MRIYNKSLSWFVLLVLEKTVDGYCRFEDFTYHHYKYHYGIPDLNKSSLSAAFRRLREGDLIEIRKDSGGIIIRLTQLGNDALGDLNFDTSKWDGIFRIVVFDIPEKQRVVRDLFRRRLKDWGFKSFQESVWVSKSNITEKLRKLIKKLGIEQWVAVVESSDKALSHIYNL